MAEIVNQEEKMRNIFETAQKMKRGIIKPAKVYGSIDDFVIGYPDCNELIMDNGKLTVKKNK